MGRPNEFGGASELGPLTGRGYLRDRLAAPDQRARIRLGAGGRLNGHRFAGEHRLIHEHLPAAEARIGGDDAAEGELDDIASYECGGRSGFPNTITSNRCG